MGHRAEIGRTGRSRFSSIAVIRDPDEIASIPERRQDSCSLAMAHFREGRRSEVKRFHDSSTYDARQIRLAQEMVRSIRSSLEAVGLEGESLKAATSDIAFSVTCAVDGSTHMEIGNDDHLVPILGFAEGRMRDRLLVPKGGGSSLHEFVPGIVAEEFGT